MNRFELEELRPAQIQSEDPIGTASFDSVCQNGRAGHDYKPCKQSSQSLNENLFTETCFRPSVSGRKIGVAVRGRAR